MRVALVHSEVVYVVFGVEFFYDMPYGLFKLRDPFAFVVYGVHVNDRHATELFRQCVFKVVYRVVQLHNVAFGRYFGVQNYDFSPGTVIVHDKVVYADNLLFIEIKREIGYFFDKFVVGRRAEQQVGDAFKRTCARVCDEYRDKKTRYSVKRNAFYESRQNRAEYDYGCRHAVRKAVKRGRAVCDGIYLFRYFAVKKRHPQFYEYRHAEYGQRYGE